MVGIHAVEMPRSEMSAYISFDAALKRSRRMAVRALKAHMHVAPKSAAARVLFAIPSMGLGGSERVILNLLRHLDTERFEPHLAVLERVGACLQGLPQHVRIHELGAKRARSAVFPLVNVCWNVRPQFVLSTSAHLNSAVVAARPLLPRQTTLLTREGADINSPEAACSWVRLLVYKRVYKRADVVICQSDYMKEDLIRHFGLARSKVVRIYNPVDIESVAALARSEPSPFPNVSPNLLGVGRFSHEKGFDLLLKCMRFVREAVPSAFLTLVGDGPDLAMLKTLQRELGLDSCVRFVGARENPYSYIKYADVLVLPSRCEALPNVVLEAIALGTSVVASNCTEALNEISSCTKLLHVANGTPETLATTIINTLMKKTERVNAGPEPQFEKRFGIRTIIREYERVLRSRTQMVAANSSSHASALA